MSRRKISIEEFLPMENMVFLNMKLTIYSNLFISLFLLINVWKLPLPEIKNARNWDTQITIWRPPMACIFSLAKKCLSIWGPLTTFLLLKTSLMKIQRISQEKFKGILLEVYSTLAIPYLHPTTKKLMNLMPQYVILLDGPVAKLKPEKQKFT